MGGKIICSMCKGLGEKIAFVSCPDSGYPALYVKCPMCAGSGYISKDRLTWINQGKRVKKDRQERGERMIHQAGRLGVTISYLSAMENGRQDNTEFVKDMPELD